jgi:cellulose synthase/poly-beta-1,6-N-acetylglucosamine synthase-like glycosyltransferase
MAYNEEANIGHLLAAALNQTLDKCRLKQIIVVASGCTDRTVEIAKGYAEEDKRVQVVIQPERQGKASAINLFLQQAKGDVFIVESGDTIPSESCYEELVLPFLDQQVGMTGARPVPVNNPHRFMGFCVHFLWGLHHCLASKHPKMGELIAFRNLVRQIPEDTAVDEASIEELVTRAGYRLCYAPQAVVYNKGPETLTDFIKQRRRIANGHMYLKQSKGYAPSTTSLSQTLRVIASRLSCHTGRIVRLAKRDKPARLLFYLLRELKRAMWAIGAIGLETIARLLGWYDLHVQHRNPVRWETIATTKRLNK